MREHKLLLIGVGISAALLVTFLVLQATASWILDLPSQWLWVALVPVLACLVAGGYIGKFKASSDGIEFESAIPKEVKGIAEAPQGLKPLVEGQKAPWQNERAAEYIRTGGHFLVHVYEPSSESGQKYDVFVYLVSHQKNSIHPTRTGFPAIRQVEYYFGHSWGEQIFTVINNGSNVLGVRTHAHGTFLAMARITFTDPNKQPITINRYMDCEMLLGLT